MVKGEALVANVPRFRHSNGNTFEQEIVWDKSEQFIPVNGRHKRALHTHASHGSQAKTD